MALMRTFQNRGIFCIAVTFGKNLYIGCRSLDNRLGMFTLIIQVQCIMSIHSFLKSLISSVYGSTSIYIYIYI